MGKISVNDQMQCVKGVLASAALYDPMLQHFGQRTLVVVTHWVTREIFNVTR